MARSLIGRLMTATSAGLGAFKAEFLQAGPRPSRSPRDDWNAWVPRKHRRDLAWSFYNGDAYDPAHPWSSSFVATYGIYPNTRPIANPVFRLVEFYVNHLLGGDLDPEAGDGSEVPSCLPILLGPSASPALRGAIAKFWRDCQFVEMKDRLSLYGSIEADVAVKLVDDVPRQRVRGDIVSTGDLADIDYKPGATVVRGYDLRRMVDDPRERRNPDDPPARVEYRETAREVEGGVAYQTFLDEKPYPWVGAASYVAPYPFVPLVVARHRDLGNGRSVNACHNAQARIIEADQQTSILSDANRKQLRMPMMFAGVQLAAEGDDCETPAGRYRGVVTNGRARGQREAEEVKSFSTDNPDAKAWHLRYQMDNEGARLHIDALLQTITLDYPELRSDQGAMAGTPTAEAVRSSRAEATKRVNARRVGYHALIVRMNQMAVAIGGFRGYPGYEGFDFGSYDAGLLDHRIGPVPVFEDSEDDRIARAKERSLVIAALVKDGGMPLEDACIEAGMDRKRAKQIAGAKAKADDEAAARSEASLRADQAATLADDIGGD